MTLDTDLHRSVRLAEALRLIEGEELLHPP
jgi:hypothetical protein